MQLFRIITKVIIYSAATSSFAVFFIAVGFDRTAAFISLSSQHGVDNSGRAADAGIHKNSSKRAIAAAGPAFHAGVAILNDDMGVNHFKNLVGANFNAHSAAGAFILIEP